MLKAVFWAVALCLLTLAAHARDPAPAEAQIKSADLRWRAPRRNYFLYQSAKAEKLGRARDSVEGAAVALDPGTTHVHLFGYEVGKDGTQDAVLGRPYVFEDLLLQLAMYTTSDKSEKLGNKWDKLWSLERFEASCPASIELKSSYHFIEVTTYNGKNCARLMSRHDLVAPQKPADDKASFNVWKQFELDCNAYFNLDEGHLEGATFDLRAERFQLNLQVANSKPTAYYMDWACEWKLARNYDSLNEPELKRDVLIAIKRGTDALMAKQRADGTWQDGGPARGVTGLALLAALMMDVDPKDERIVKGFEALKPLPEEQIYSVAVSLMAYEAKYISVDEKRAFLEDRKVEKFVRNVSDEDKREMQRLLDWIVKNQGKTTPFWNYEYAAPTGTAKERFDFSCTQYALLGLCAALRCGLTIPAGVIKRVGDELVKMQEPDGPEVKRVLKGKPPKPGKPGKTTTGRDREPDFTRAPRATKARGFAYTARPVWDKARNTTTAYGSMTTSGLAQAAILLDIAAQMTPEQIQKEFGSTQVHKRWADVLLQSIDGGLAWMEVWFSVTRNAQHGRTWYYYYLYGLERVGMLCDVRWMGEHDWYAEGASVLVCLQQTDASWGNSVDTAFALLFLKKGTVPTRTRPVVTGDK